MAKAMVLMLGAILLTACDRRANSGPVVVSAIGDPPAYPPPGTVPGLPARVLLDATAQGLVRFDAGGQIEPGLAERWTVMDDGASYIFRLREAYWANGRRVTAEEIVRLLRRRLIATDNPLAPFLTAIDEIVVMTPQVIEIRLNRPRPDLLKLFAQPDMTLIARSPPSGSGPLRIVQAAADGRVAARLRPAFDPGQADPDDQRDLRPEQDVRLIGERAARAIVRFARRDSDLVSGGTLADWPLLATIDLPRTSVRRDPAAGLFGLAIARRDGFLADPANRTALSAAIDRGAIVAAIAPGWEATDRLLPEALDSAAPPQVPDWTLLTIGQRQAAARARVAAFSPVPVRLAIALPPGPGMTLLYGQLAAAWRRIGILLDRVGPDEPADLRLIDTIAPYDSARWYLATACMACGEQAAAALEAARLAPTITERGVRLAAADAAMNADAGFLPIARPLRWSLVANRLSAWQANPRAWHPLNRLRPDPT
ncbi:ABC transporter substrate-binding protein [Sphingomonas sp. CFBP 8760]|nr:ABC transporter substrate-binding protein [Sphingomonas sp. CFBP 8760]